LLLQWDKLVTVKIFYIHPASDTSDADDDLHDTYTEHTFFLLNVNNPSVRHPVWPRLAPRRATVGPLSATPSSPCRVEIFYIFFWLLLPAGKEGKKYFGFWFSIPKFPEFPELHGLCGRSRKKKKVFSAYFP
jgi:hypothetical protein